MHGLSPTVEKGQEEKQLTKKFTPESDSLIKYKW